MLHHYNAQISRDQRFGLSPDGLSLQPQMRILAQILVLFTIGLLLSSCYADPNCIGLRNDVIGISFRQKSSNESTTVELSGINLSNSDSVFNAGASTTQVYLPLNVNETQQTINFNLSTGSFSMVVEYLSQPQFESVDCGPRFVLSNLKIVEHNFDSAFVSGSIPLTESSGTNIVVYPN